MAHLRAKTGATHELRDLNILGRQPDCEVMLDVVAVSRRHAQIVRQGDEWSIEDLHSRNGTYVNGRRIESRQSLRHGDHIKICDLEFVFDDGRRPGSEWALSLPAATDEVVADLAPGSDQPGGETYRIVRRGPLSFAAECRELRQALEQSHLVFYPADSSSRLADRLLLGGPDALVLRPEHLRYTVVLDGLRGFEGGQFQLDRFYNYVCRQLTTAFGLRPSDTYHEEDVIQILRSAPPSLLCLVNTSSIPHRERCSLRGLTQEAHPTLVIYRGARDDEVEIDFEQTDAAKESILDSLLVESTPHASATAEVKLRAIMEISWGMARNLDLNSALARVLDSLFKIFPQAERGFVVLQVGDGPLAPAAVKFRRETDEAVRISRSVVKRVMSTREAVLTADAVSDARFEMSNSIADFNIRSMMCVPLVGSLGEPQGVLQIDTKDPRHRFQAVDLDVLAAVASQAALAIENARLYESSLQREQFDRQLTRARQIQTRISPVAAPQVPGYSFFHHFESPYQVASDLFDYLPLADGRTAIVLGDVAGHGVGPALVATALARDLRNFAAGATGAAELLGRVNESFQNLEDVFATVALLILDPARHEITIANAGHMAPLIRRAATGEIESLGEAETGLPLWIVPDFTYEESRAALAPGDTVVLYSDGVSEALDASGTQYGMERLRRVLHDSPGSAEFVGESLLFDLRQFSGGRPPQDDACLICFSRDNQDGIV